MKQENGLSIKEKRNKIKRANNNLPNIKTTKLNNILVSPQSHSLPTVQLPSAQNDITNTNITIETTVATPISESLAIINPGKENMNNDQSFHVTETTIISSGSKNTKEVMEKKPFQHKVESAKQNNPSAAQLLTQNKVTNDETSQRKQEEITVNNKANFCIPPAPITDRKRIKEFLRRKKYKRPEAKTKDDVEYVLSPDIKKLMTLSRGNHGNSHVIENVKKKYEKMKADATDMRMYVEQDLRRGYQNDFRVTRNLRMYQFASRKLALFNVRELKKIEVDPCQVPDLKEANKILRRMCNQKRAQLEAYIDTQIQRQRVSDNYAWVLRDLRENETLLECLRIQHAKERLGKNVIRNHIKMLNCIYQSLSTNGLKVFSKKENTSLKAWRQKIQGHASLRKRFQDTIAQMNEYIRIQRQSIEEQMKTSESTTLEVESMEQQLKVLVAEYESKVLFSEEYTSVCAKKQELTESFAKKQQLYEEELKTLEIQQEQLETLKSEPKDYDHLFRKWNEIRVKILQKSEEVKQRQMKRELLNGEIRERTGRILDLEIRQSAKKIELASVRKYKEELARAHIERLHKFKRLTLKYQPYNQFTQQYQANENLICS